MNPSLKVEAVLVNKVNANSYEAVATGRTVVNRRIVSLVCVAAALDRSNLSIDHLSRLNRPIRVSRANCD